MIDKDWRPANWTQMRIEIARQSTVWSPSKGYSPDTKEQMMEQTASQIIEAVLKELEKSGK